MPLGSPYAGQRLCLATQHGKQGGLGRSLCCGPGDLQRRGGAPRRCPQHLPNQGVAGRGAGPGGMRGSRRSPTHPGGAMPGLEHLRRPDDPRAGAGSVSLAEASGRSLPWGDRPCVGLGGGASLQRSHATCWPAGCPRGLQWLKSPWPVWLETVMEAHRSPIRLRSFRRLGVALMRRLCSACPGWGLVASAARTALPGPAHGRRSRPLSLVQPLRLQASR